MLALTAVLALKLSCPSFLWLMMNPPGSEPPRRPGENAFAGDTPMLSDMPRTLRDQRSIERFLPDAVVPGNTGNYVNLSATRLQVFTLPLPGPGTSVNGPAKTTLPLINDPAT